MPLLDDRRGRRNRGLLGAGVALLIAMSLALPAMGGVILKMLPFDNKSEFQVVVDMPAGTPLEQTAGVLRELGAFLVGQPEVSHYQAYAGTASPINFNGLMRQYYLRSGGEVGDLQVTLLDKAHRSEKSHAIVKRLRPGLQEIGRRLGANVKLVEVPPGPPVLSPLVAEIYGPDAQGRQQVARAVRGRAGGDAGRGRRRRQQHRRRAAQAPADRPPQGRPAGRAAGGHREHLARRPGAAKMRPGCTTRASTRRRRCCSCRPSATASSMRCCSCRCAARPGSSCRSASSSPSPTPSASSRSITRTCCR